MKKLVLVGMVAASVFVGNVSAGNGKGSTCKPSTSWSIDGAAKFLCQ